MTDEIEFRKKTPPFRVRPSPTPAAPQVPETIWLWWSDVSNCIRKWSSKPFKQGAAYVLKSTSERLLSELDAKYLQEVSKRLILEAELATARNEALEELMEVLKEYQTSVFDNDYERGYDEAICQAMVEVRALKTDGGA